MSLITVSFQKKYRDLVKENYLDLNDKIADFTANLFSKKKEEIIIEFTEFEFYSGDRDFLVRAETSRKNIDLLETWVEGLKDIFLKSGLNKSGIKIGIKTYVVDSCWKECFLERMVV